MLPTRNARAEFSSPRPILVLLLIFLGADADSPRAVIQGERTREIDMQIGRPDGALCGPSGTRNARLGARCGYNVTAEKY